MRILWDHQAFSYQRHGGVSRSFVELFKRIPSENSVLTTPFFGHNVYAKDVIQQWPDPLPDFTGKIKIKKWINHSLAKQRIKQNDFDLMHVTYHDTYFLSSLRKPFVMTVHDCIHEEHLDALPVSESKTLSHKQTLIEKASAIVAVSDATKGKLMKHYPKLNPAKVFVVPHGHEHLPHFNQLSRKQHSSCTWEVADFTRTSLLY